MDQKRHLTFLAHLRQSISLRVHNRRLQTRLQLGSSLALGIGLVLSALFLGDLLAPLEIRFARFLFPPVDSPLPPIEQDYVVQITMIFLMALLAGATLPHLHFLPAAGLTILYVLGYSGYASAEFGNGILVRPLYPILALLLTFLAMVIVRYFDEDRARGSAWRLFRRSMGPEMLERVLGFFDRQALPLAGTLREVTLVCVDLRDFNDLSPAIPPEQLLCMLEQYSTRTIATVFHHEGMIVKEAGDMILAAWNLPLEQRDHWRMAVDAAMEIRHETTKLSEGLPKEIELRVGIGVATGSAAAGNVAVKNREEYTLVGQVVSLAERLAIKHEQGVCIDRATWEHICDELPTREVNPVRLRRKTDPAEAWEICEPMELEE